MAGPITIAIIGDNKGLNSSLDQSTSKLGKFGSTAGKVGGIVALGLAGAGVAAVGIGAKLFAMGDAADDSNGKIRNIAGQMKLFGGEVDAVSNRLIAYAEATARATGVDQNSIKATQAKLLTFGELASSADKVGGNFDRATKAAIDLAAAGFGSAESNAAQLGKALNDPVKGLTALTKSGVTFTEAEKARIATLVESNQTAKAQGLVLSAIEKQVGGTAESMAGGFDRLKITVSQAGERIGVLLVPVVDKLAGLIADQVFPAVAKVTPYVAAFAQEAGTSLAPALAAVVAGGTKLVPIVTGLGSAWLTVASSVASNVLPMLQQAGGFLSTTFGPVIGQVAGIVTGQLIPGVQAVAGFIGGKLLPIVTQTATKVGSNLAPVFRAVAGTLKSDVLPAVNQGANKFREWWPTIQKVTTAVVKVAAAGVDFGTKVLGKVLPPVIRFAGFLAGNLIGAVVGAIGVVVKIGGAVVDAGQKFVNGVQAVAKFANGVREKVGSAIDVVTGIPGRIKGVFAGAGSLLLSIGGDIVQGLVNGITGAADRVLGAAQALIDKIPGPIRKAMGIASPSRVMKQIGKFIVAGLVDGIAGGRNEVSAAMNGLVDRFESAWEKLHKGKNGKAKDIKPERLKKFVASIEDEQKRLGKLADKYGQVANKLANARAKYAELSNAAREYGALTNTEGFLYADGTQDPVSGQSIIQGLQGRLNAITNFAGKIEQLRRAGLNKTSIDQILAAGVEEGSQYADALVAGGQSTVTEVNRLESLITGAANQLGANGALAMYGTGQQTYDGFIAGLEADQARLEKAAKKIAKTLTKAIKKELGIKSPSRVARTLSRQFTDGIIVQTYADTKRVQKAGQATAKAIVAGFNRPQLTADALGAGVYNGKSRDKLDVAVELSAETMSQLERGRKAKLDIQAYENAGG